MNGLLYVSLHENSGYGVAGRRLLFALRDEGVPVTWTPMVSGNGWRLGYESFEQDVVEAAGELASLCNRTLSYDTVILHTVPEYFPLWRERLLRKIGGDPPLILGHTVWETDRLPRHWPEALRSVDGLLVPSRWNVDVFEGADLGRPVLRVPHVLDTGMPTKREREAAPPFRFYTIGTWTHRKTLDLTVRAYLRAFTSQHPVELVIKTSPQDFTAPRGRVARRLFGSHGSVEKALKRLIREHPGAAPIRMITAPLSDREIRELHLDGDCFVSLCRSEGWGLGAFDALTLGNPVIMTDYGGQLDYLGEDWPFLVRSTLVPVRDPVSDSYSRDQTWAEPDLEHAAGLLRQVFEEPESAFEHAAAASSRLRERYSPGRVAGDLVREVETLRRAGSVDR